MDENKWFRTKSAMSKAFGKDIKTINKWVNKPGFPKKHSRWRAWHRASVIRWVENHVKRLEANKPSDALKAKKLRLDCERLKVVIAREKERLTQAKIETLRQKGEVVARRSVVESSRAVCRVLRDNIESFRKHHIAKYPKHKTLIDALCDNLRKGVYEEFMSE